MTQTTSRFFDELGKLMTDAAGAAHGVRKEVETLVRAQAERVLNEMNVVQREDFDAVKAMARKAREENDRLAARLADVESKLEILESECAGQRGKPAPPRPIRTDKVKPSI